MFREKATGCQNQTAFPIHTHTNACCLLAIIYVILHSCLIALGIFVSHSAQKRGEFFTEKSGKHFSLPQKWKKILAHTTAFPIAYKL